MDKTIKSLIEKVDDCDDPVYPDFDEKFSKEDKNLMKEISEILCHDRFNHEGWTGGYDYQEDAAYFILKLIKETRYKL